MRKALLSLALLAGSFAAGAQTLPGLVLNELSQGQTSSQKEYFEFVVAGTRTCTDSTLDLRNWIFDDNNGWIATGSGTGIAAGAMRFANVANWAAVPYGSVILIYSDIEKNNSITLPDDPTDANHDYVYVLKANSTLLQKNTTDPSAPSSASFTYSTTGWSNGGDWATVALANGGDGVVIVKPTTLNNEYFSFGFVIGSASTATVWVPDMPGGKNYFLTNANFAQAASWQQGDAGLNETPGAPNGGANTTWINSMRVQATGVTVAAVSSSNGNVLCVGSTTNLSSTTPGGTWSSATPAVVSVNSSTGVATAVAAGGPVTITYTVTSGGCTGTATYDITAVSAANAGTVSGAANLCVGATSTFTSNGTPGGTWSSSNAAVATVNPATGVVTGVTGGGPVNIIYSVGTGSCAATASAPITVTAAPALQPTTGPATLCVGSSAQFTNPFQPNGAGTWSATPAGLVTVTPTLPAGGPSIVNVTAVAPGAVTLNFTAGTAGCTSTMPFALLVVAAPVVPPSTGASNVCVGGTTTLSNSAPSGTWSSADGTIATVNPATGVVSGVAAGNVVINYTVNNGTCSTVQPFNLTVNALPAAPSISGNTTFCLPGNTTLTVNPTPASFTVQIAPASVATLGAVTASTFVVQGVSAGNATVTVTATNAAGCSAQSAPVTVTAVDKPVVAPVLGGTNLCSGTTVTLSNATPGGVWSSSNTAAATVNPATGVVTGVATGTANIIYTVTNAAGCTGTSQAAINVTSTPAPGPITGNTTLCVGSTSTLANALAAGTWSSGNTALATINATTGVVTGIAPGTNIPIAYTVTNNGCTGTANATVTVTAAPVLAPIAAQALCAGSTATLTPSITGGTWTSSNPAAATISNTGVLTGVAAGNSQLTYTVTSGGCTASQVVNVTVNSAAVQLNASATTINAGQSVTLTPVWTGTAPFTVTAWAPPALLPNQSAATQTLAPAATTTFSVTGNDANGCTATGSVTVTVNVPVTDDLFVPNYFTPNNDGRNDVLYFYGSSVTSLDFRIFNQWGEQVFASTDKARGWDGSASGKQQPVGVYMYVAKVTLTNGQTRTLKGSINLIR
ncbi:MAG: T9SS type B sorting domain-containing protein [Chitinophagaceae bacterium]|nr:MAG: T9SS type B sorting domain-containing protein [Chitinophagaceae bacterium]